MNNAIFVTGYYRSGTSALSGALTRLGVYFHNNMKANKHNPLGFYETAELIDFDDQIFKAFDMDWSDLRRMPFNWAIKPELNRAVIDLAGLLNHLYIPNVMWGIKHPYHCRLLPIYLQASMHIQNTKFHNINIARNPWQSAASQIKKNNLSKSHALLLWVIYVVESIKNSKNMSRVCITYDALLHDPIAQFERIQSVLNIKFFYDLEDGKKYITDELNHKTILPKAGIYKKLVELVDNVWEALRLENFDTDLWDDFEVICNEMVDLIVDMGKTSRRAVPGLDKKDRIG